SEAESLKTAGAAATADELIYLLRSFLDADTEMRRSPHPRVELEVAAVRTTQRPEPKALDTLLEKVEDALGKLRNSPGSSGGGSAGTRSGVVQESLLTPSKASASERAPASTPAPSSRSVASPPPAQEFRDAREARTDRADTPKTSSAAPAVASGNLEE